MEKKIKELDLMAALGVNVITVDETGAHEYEPTANDDESAASDNKSTKEKK